jgi:predicted nucleotidyltransferase
MTAGPPPKSVVVILHRLRRYMLLDIVSHWIFQGMVYTDRTERNFKLFLDGLFTAIAGTFLSFRLPKYYAWPIAFFVAHTLNFLFNGQLSVLGKNHGLQHTNYEKLQEYLAHLKRRAKQEPAIQKVVIVGSVSEHRWSPTSDLDVRVLRYPGFINGLRAVLFILRERTFALFRWFPLDIYLLDSEAALSRSLQEGEQETNLLDESFER